MIDGPSGKYRFLATFQKGEAAAGGDVEFYVADPAEMPQRRGGSRPLGRRCRSHHVAQWQWHQGARLRPGTHNLARESILVGNRPAAGGAEAFAELARHIARGSTPCSCTRRYS